MGELIDSKTFWLIVHVFGAVFGAGGAFMSDAMFFTSIKDEKLTKTELRFLALGGRMVWAGLAVLAFSGVMLVAQDPAGYLSSDKFLAKAAIVAVIVLNGFVFHVKHFPLLFRHAGVTLGTSDEFVRSRPFILVSGAVSMVSWTSTLILGMLKYVPYSFSAIFGAYLIVVTGASFGAYFMRDLILPHRAGGPAHWLSRVFDRNQG